MGRYNGRFRYYNYPFNFTRMCISPPRHGVQEPNKRETGFNRTCIHATRANDWRFSGELANRDGRLAPICKFFIILSLHLLETLLGKQCSVKERIRRRLRKSQNMLQLLVVVTNWHSGSRALQNSRCGLIVGLQGIFSYLFLLFTR